MTTIPSEQEVAAMIKELTPEDKMIFLEFIWRLQSEDAE